MIKLSKNQQAEAINLVNQKHTENCSYSKNQLDIFTVYSTKNLKTQKTIVGIKNKLTYVKKYKSMKRKRIKKHIHYDSTIIDQIPQIGDKILVKTVPRISKLKSKIFLKILQ